MGAPLGHVHQLHGKWSVSEVAMQRETEKQDRGGRERTHEEKEKENAARERERGSREPRCLDYIVENLWGRGDC